jgi:hypothetical protein
MNIDTNAAAAEHAAHRAIGEVAKAENLKALAEIAVHCERGHQLDHIRGIVATTLAHLAADATAATRENAAQWQQWALGLGDALLSDTSAPALHR